MKILIISVLSLPAIVCFHLNPCNLRRLASGHHLNLFDRPTNDESRLGADVEAEVEEKEYSSFFRSLGQWPLSSVDSSSAAPEAIEEKETPVLAQSSGRYSGGANALSDLLKLEVILDLADGLKFNESESYFASIMATADQLFKAANSKENVDGEQNIDLGTTVEELIESEKWLQDLSSFEGLDTENKMARLSFTQSNAITSNSTQQNLGQAAEAWMKDTTSRIEYLVNEASKGLLTPTIVNDLVFRSSQVFSSNGTSVEQLTNDIVRVAESIAKKNGLDVSMATDRAREATKGATAMVNVANGIFESGYAYGSRSGVAGSEGFPFEEAVPSPESRPLFADFESATRVEPHQYNAVLTKGAEMGVLAGAIYEECLTRCHKIGHSLVANGTTADVAWMVTDSIDYYSSFLEDSTLDEPEPMLLRTITIRGFDASDGEVDRERLLVEICNASGKSINPETPNILFHSGLLEIAKKIYKDVKKFIDWADPKHRLVINGHSIGGSLSVLLLLLMVEDKGVDWVKQKVLRVYTYGSPPIAAMKGEEKNKRSSFDGVHCQILESFNLPANMVFGYVQPYDPIVRFLSDYDSLYPLVDDLGPDEVTLYVSGPPRSLRPIARALFQSWDGWPEFRDSWKGTNQGYQTVGIQHILMPEPLRYLNDRFITANIGVPPTETIVRISPDELLPALNVTFPLDVFQISLVPQAVRSFLHHFYPAYDTTLETCAAKIDRKLSAE